MINVIIVDDEPLAQDVLETYIEKIPELHLVQKCNNAFEANDALKSNAIDLMFLDIQMPQITGIDFLKTLNKPPLVIFTTAYSNYAIEGFELNALDYLLKPIDESKLKSALEKYQLFAGNQKKDIIGNLMVNPLKWLSVGGSFIKGTGHAVADSEITGIPAGENYTKNRWSIGGIITTSPFSLRSEYLAGKDGTVKSDGFYATGSCRLLRNFDLVVSYDYFNSIN